MANAEYISYASPNALVYESETYQADMGQEAMEILYPDLGDFAQQYNTLAYRNLSNEMLDYVNTLWETLKINCPRGKQAEKQRGPADGGPALFSVLSQAFTVLTASGTSAPP